MTNMPSGAESSKSKHMRLSIYIQYGPGMKWRDAMHVAVKVEVTDFVIKFAEHQSLASKLSLRSS